MKDINNAHTFLLLSSATLSFAICLFVLFCIVHYGGTAASAQITGSLESCDNEGQSVDVSNLPFMKCYDCTCKHGFVECIKQKCPNIEACHELEDLKPGECCRKCKVLSQYMNPPKGACILGKTIHKPGTEFSIDNCTDCVCNNSTLRCEKKICPVLKCKQKAQKILLGQCCPQCINVEENNQIDEVRVERGKSEKETAKSCLYYNKIYKESETWNTSNCESCTCTQGKINCTPIMCPATNCPSNSVLKVFEGQCCPECVESEGVCTVFGGSHFRTFDGKLYAFIGSCKYNLVSDCDSERFSIRLKTDIVGNDATIKRISLKNDNTKVDLHQNKNIKVNDSIIDLPYHQNMLEIAGTNEVAMLSTKIGLKIHWNYAGFLEVTVSSSYRKSLCGLCGNYNSIADDDLTTREGISVDDPAIFAQSWTLGDEVCLQTRKYGIRGCNPRKDQRICNYMKGSVFEKCLKKINVASYYAKCIVDMCECPPEDLECHCESFAGYVRDCRRLGILLRHWRKSVGC